MRVIAALCYKHPYHIANGNSHQSTRLRQANQKGLPDGLHFGVVKCSNGSIGFFGMGARPTCTSLPGTEFKDPIGATSCLLPQPRSAMIFLVSCSSVQLSKVLAITLELSLPEKC